MSRITAIMVGAVWAALLPLSAGAATVTTGWAHSDVGLENNGDGVYLGLSQAVAWDNPVFDAAFGLEYVQKKGSQPTPFVHPQAGFVVEDASVTLHVLQPSIFMGARVPNLPFVPRVYLGGSIGLKVKESWSDFPGIPNIRYGYKETDAIVHLGASLGMGPVSVDLRWSRSLVGQLLIDPNEVAVKSAEKASDPLPGVRVPEVGHDTQVVRLGVAVSF